MTPNETTQLRTMAEIFRRLREENVKLRESLGMETEERKAFDDENVELFDVVHKNHDRRGTIWQAGINPWMPGGSRCRRTGSRSISGDAFSASSHMRG